MHNMVRAERYKRQKRAKETLQIKIMKSLWLSFLVRFVFMCFEICCYCCCFPCAFGFFLIIILALFSPSVSSPSFCCVFVFSLSVLHSFTIVATAERRCTGKKYKKKIRTNYIRTERACNKITARTTTIAISTMTIFNKHEPRIGECATNEKEK